MSNLDELGGTKRAAELANCMGGEEAEMMEALIERVEELEREEKESRREVREMAVERGIVFPKEDEIPVSSMACDLMTCIDGRDKLLKPLRELAEMVRRGEWQSKIEAKVHECLKVVDK